ncbi:oxidoreductase [Brevundimonas sp. PAMC22021]|uniref:oxidoreductase n=1 Tax=Brevundimonas sp. PAMC22021 TaxID=2861285 RepID=UPI001C627AB6|nr:oxidoreductase [Brevundimonas sp. PAMC22021]QYF86817.1 oxidoreductase [Brevundimonas sp. PAMC22021]
MVQAQPLNVALVGFGYGGRTFHAPLIGASPRLRLHTVVSSRPEAVHARLPDAKVVPDLAAALTDPNIALVVVAAPNAEHAPLARQALETGRAVVVDKPFTLTLAEAVELVGMTEARGRLLSVFHNRRWDADFLTLQSLVEADRLGRIVRLESRFNRYRPEVRDRWREADVPGAGVWYDLGPHLIDQALVLFGMPVGVSADLTILRDGGKACDYAHVVLRYPDRRVILHADMLSAEPDPRFLVQGTRAAFLSHGLDPQEEQLKATGGAGGAGWGVDPQPGEIIDGATGAREPAPGVPGDYRRYYDGIAAALLEGAPNPVPPDEAVAVMAVLETARISAEQGREVCLDGLPIRPGAA